MATLAEELRAIAYEARGIAGGLGLRPYSVAVVRGTWSGPHTGDGALTELEEQITEADGQPPKVKWMRDEQLVYGEPGTSEIEVGPITPRAGVLERLAPAVAAGVTVHLKLTGPESPNGRLFKIREINTQSATKYLMRATPAE